MKKIWYRQTEQAWVAGVLAGLADYFGHDPLLFRIAMIAGTILTAIVPGVVLYILAWMLVPLPPTNGERTTYQYEG